MQSVYAYSRPAKYSTNPVVAKCEYFSAGGSVKDRIANVKPTSSKEGFVSDRDRHASGLY